MRRLAALLVALALLSEHQRPSVQAAETVPRYGLVEASVTATRTFANPWQDAALTVQLAGPSGQSATIPGFYFGGQEWRFRYSPEALGAWSWVATLRDSGGNPSGISNGAFTVVASGDRGWLRVREGPGPARLVHRDGSLFPVSGIGDCMLDVDGDGSPLTQDYGFDGGVAIPGHPGERYGTFDSYLAAYGHDGAKFTLFRLSLDNCAFRVFETIEPGKNRYRLQESAWTDTAIAKLRANGVRVWFVLFGFSAPYQLGATPAQLDSVRHYVRYAAARWGAMVDVWEVANEIGQAAIDKSYLEAVAAELKVSAPYGRPVTTSFDQVDVPEMTLTAPHWYPFAVDAGAVGAVTQSAIESNAQPRKPLVYGEAGNRGSNWDPESGLRMRLKAYTAWFLGAGIVWWNTSAKQGYTGNPANVYIGPDERAQNRAFTSFIEKMPGSVAPFSPQYGFSDLDFGSGEGVRVRGLRDGSNVFVYAEYGKARVSGLFVTTSFAQPAVATWYEPRTGKVLRSQFAPAGQATLAAPAFWEDIALAVVPAGNSGLSLFNVSLLPR